ncbi:DUF6568 family protein [Enterococcus sp. LJL98]
MPLTYEENTANFTIIDSKKAEEMIKEKQEAVIYIGRPTCSFCRMFVQKLKVVADQTQTDIYYIESSNIADDQNISDFRMKYQIPTVPGLLYTNEGVVKVKCHSAMPEEEIRQFINK